MMNDSISSESGRGRGDASARDARSAARVREDEDVDEERQGNARVDVRVTQVVLGVAGGALREGAAIRAGLRC